MRTEAEKRVVMDSLVGKPFVRMPGALGEHVVCGETYDGTKIRVGAVEMVFNDALLMDAIEGDGCYRGTAGSLNLAALEIAERLYGVTLARAVTIWLRLDNLKCSIVWPGNPGVDS